MIVMPSRRASSTAYRTNCSPIFRPRQRGRNIRVIDYDQLFSRTTVCHLGFVPIDDDPVASLGCAIFPLNLFAHHISPVSMIVHCGDPPIQ